ncbi:hypothetical protein U1Q18_036221 [Sarracenia purpurea var. burkii]
MAAHQICLQVWLAVSLLTDALASSAQRASEGSGDSGPEPLATTPLDGRGRRPYETREGDQR